MIIILTYDTQGTLPVASLLIIESIKTLIIINFMLMIFIALTIGLIITYKTFILDKPFISYDLAIIIAMINASKH